MRHLLGQVTVHYRLKKEAGDLEHATECFECAPKQSRTKTYPVCTIRNTPDKPIHCIVWAKELLFARLFGRWVLCLLPHSDHRLNADAQRLYYAHKEGQEH